MARRKHLTKHQSGNKKLHSTEMLNIFMSDIILDAMNKKEMTALVLLDLSKAFDSIEHSLLLRKLRTLGMSKDEVDWFRSNAYWPSIIRSWRTLIYGVPQGSILGQALFNIYMNYLPGIPGVCFLESYDVDDSKLYLSFPVKNAGVAEIQFTNETRIASRIGCRLFTCSAI